MIGVATTAAANGVGNTTIQADGRVLPASRVNVWPGTSQELSR